MSGDPSYPPLAITEYWSRLNDNLVELVDCIPDDRFEWSPAPQLWNLRGVLLHIAGARHRWMEKAVRDGESTPDLLREGQTRDGLKTQLRLSWQRLERFLQDPDKLSREYPSADDDGAWQAFAQRPQRAGNGYWIAFHRLQHDAIHRADVLNYLSLLGVELPESGSPT
jgi:uncharacterized damage-inducible protein DinB